MNNFSRLIVNWYRLNKRYLPWREEINPYYIWLSEIILQQTKVSQGTPYYFKFLQKYPTIIKLADAEEKEILNDWQGLGYYSRARNLHYTAKYIRDNLNGEFPKNYTEILKLKGVGKYTAAAISSFAFNEKKAVVDGNVYRLLSRYFDIETPIDSSAGIKEFQSLADILINKKNPGEHNQAMMEIGALICTPKKPKCIDCPLSLKCISYAADNIQNRPVKKTKTKIKNRFFHYLIFNCNEELILEKRTKKDIWKNMYQFPLIEVKNIEEKIDLSIFKNKLFESSIRKHILSHQIIYAKFHHFESLSKFDANWFAIKKSELENYPIPRIIDKYLEEQKLF